MMKEELKQELVELHESSFGWALAKCGWDREEAQEVLQMTYLKILEGKARFDGRSSLKTWFFSLIRKTAAENRRRAILRRLGISRFLASGISRTTGIEKEVTQSEIHRHLTGVLRSLPERQREVLALVFYQDLTVEEAAAVMNVTVGTARTHYERGKRQLRARLNPAVLK